MGQSCRICDSSSFVTTNHERADFITVFLIPYELFERLWRSASFQFVDSEQGPFLVFVIAGCIRGLTAKALKRHYEKFEYGNVSAQSKLVRRTKNCRAWVGWWICHKLVLCVYEFLNMVQVYWCFPPIKCHLRSPFPNQSDHPPLDSSRFSYWLLPHSLCCAEPGFTGFMSVRGWMTPGLRSEWLFDWWEVEACVYSFFLIYSPCSLWVESQIILRLKHVVSSHLSRSRIE